MFNKYNLKQCIQ